MTTRTMDEWLDAYGESHQNPTNKKVHFVCVPVIFFSIVGFLWAIPAPFFAGFWAFLTLVGVTLYYARLPGWRHPLLCSPFPSYCPGHAGFQSGLPVRPVTDRR